MQPADDVKLGHRFGVAGSRGLEGLFERHRVGAGSVFLAAEGAQAAGRHANVGRIDMAIDVEVRLVAVHALADLIRQPADGEDVAGAVERESVVVGQAFAGQHLVVNGLEAGVVGLEWMHAGASLDDNAGRRKSPRDAPCQRRPPAPCP